MHGLVSCRVIAEWQEDARVYRDLQVQGLVRLERGVGTFVAAGAGQSIDQRLFRELDRGRVKVSLRSKGALDVHALATEFGGGGHRNASGIVMAGSLDDAVGRVVERATALVTAGRRTG